MTIDPAYFYAPAGPPPLVTHRSERIIVELLDEFDNLRGQLAGVQVGGTIEQNVHRQVRGGGNIVLVEDDSLPWPIDGVTTPLRLSDVDWYKDRIRVSWSVEGGPRWALGTFIVSAPSVSFGDGFTSLSAELLDKLTVPQQDAVEASYSLAPGTVVTDAVEALLLTTGETRMAITESAATLGSGFVWEAGTSKLRVINDLLASINYFSLWCDGSGQYRAEPYVRPDDRTPSWRFEEGETSIHSPEWTREQDLYNVPNRVVLVSQGDGETEALTSTYPATEAESDEIMPKLGYSARGRWIVHPETGVEANTQAVLDSLARQRLADLADSVANLSVLHAAVPLELNNTVYFRSQGHEALAVVQELAYTLGEGELCRSSWREVGGGM